MLSKLQIWNFQSWPKAILKFHKGVNVIIGSTDSGKTAILRALRWVIWNVPSGNAFRSSWGGFTKVQLHTNGSSITRSKGKGDLYKLNKTPFKSFGRKVPVEIEKAINITPDNFQEQLESLFLVTRTPGAVAQHYNEVANLTQINAVRDSIQKDIRGFSETIKFNTKEIEKEKKNLKQYDNIEEIENAVSELEKLVVKSDKLADDISSIAFILLQHKTIVQDIKNESIILQDEKTIDEALALYKEVKKLNKDSLEISDIIHTLEVTDIDISTIDQKAKAKPKVLRLLKMKKEHRELGVDLTELNSYVVNITSVTKKMKINKGELVLLNDNFVNAFGKLKICPTCNTKLKK